MLSSTNAPHPRPKTGLRCLAVVTTSILLGTAPAGAQVDAENDASLQAIATAQLDSIRQDLNTAQDLDVLVAASVHAVDGSVAAPPRRSSFAFSRPTDDRPFRFSLHSWSGPGGGSDLVCDGTGLVVGDPLLRRYEMRSAPATAADVLADVDLAPRLGVGPAFILAALSTGILDDLVLTEEITPCTIAGRASLAVRCRTSDEPDAPTLELIFPRDGEPVLQRVTMPVEGTHTVALVFADWKKDATRDRIDGRARFSMIPPPSWVKIASHADTPETGEASAPVQALVGRRAPRIVMRDAEGNMVDPLTDMTVPVALLFTAEDALNDRAARDFATLTRNDDRFRGYRIQLASDELTLPRDDRDLVADTAGCGSSWRLSGLPTLVIITPDGRVRAAQVGHPGLSTWSARLTPLLDRLASVPDAE
ncbi:MAG: hypothetical protein P8J59_01375 [Phycisphaerales bacterium]|jgi:hypothetical protein|nr:hypothetical protein [Phycisphaerales bacterium]